MSSAVNNGSGTETTLGQVSASFIKALPLCCEYANFARRNNQVSDLPSYLIPQWLAWDDSYFLAYPFVSMEIQRELSIILFYNKPRSLFYSLRSDTTLGEKKRVISYDNSLDTSQH